MGESDRYIDRRVKKLSLGEDNNALVALVSINAAGLIILGLIKVIYLTIDSSSANFNIADNSLVFVAGKTCHIG